METKQGIVHNVSPEFHDGHSGIQSNNKSPAVRRSEGLECASDMANRLLRDRATHRCNCELAAQDDQNVSRGGRRSVPELPGRRDQDGELLKGRDVTTDSTRGRMGSVEDSSAESGETVVEYTAGCCPNGDPIVNFVPEPEAKVKVHFIRLSAVLSACCPTQEYRPQRKLSIRVVKAAVTIGTAVFIAIVCFLAGYFTVSSDMTSSSDLTGMQTEAPQTLWPDWATVLKTEPGLINQRGCGRIPDYQMRIVGGSDARPGRWPWLGSMQYRLGERLVHRCAASLLNQEWAITAAHCVTGGVGYILDHIIFGDHDLEGSSTSRQVVSVDRILAHPGFVRGKHAHELALLKLSRRVRLGVDVLPACIETEPFEVERYEECYIAGWGSVEEYGNISSILQEAKIPLVSKDVCSTQYADHLSTSLIVITDNMICAGVHAGGIDACQSDSGGPLACRGGDGSWRVVGLTSFGFGCGRPGYSGVYTRVSRYWDFIKSVVTEAPAPTVHCEDLTVPACLQRLPYSRVYRNDQSELARFLTEIPASLATSNRSADSPTLEAVETLMCLIMFPSCEAESLAEAVIGGGRQCDDHDSTWDLCCPSCRTGKRATGPCQAPCVNSGFDSSVAGPCRDFCVNSLVLPCREFCFATSRSVYLNGSVLSLAFLADCEKDPTGHTADTVFCRRGVNADCGSAHLRPSAANHSLIVSPRLPGGYDEPSHGCTWWVTGPVRTDLVFKFSRFKFPSTGKVIVIGRGVDVKNRSSVIANVLGPHAPRPLSVHGNTAWVSFASMTETLLEYPASESYFSIEVYAAESQQGRDVCRIGLNGCGQNELCFPSWWRCDNITDCRGDDDEANCTTAAILGP